MKRHTDSNHPNDSKRAKLDIHNLFDPAHQIKALDLQDFAGKTISTDSLDFIAVQVFHSYKTQSGEHIRVQSNSGQNYILDIHIFPQLLETDGKPNFSKGSHLQVSLGGARVLKRPASSVPLLLPVILSYDEKLVVKVLANDTGEDKILEIKKKEVIEAGKSKPPPDDWFATPVDPPSNPPPQLPATKDIQEQSNSASTEPIRGPIRRDDPPSMDPHRTSSNAQERVKQSKKQKREAARKRKREKEALEVSKQGGEVHTGTTAVVVESAVKHVTSGQQIARPASDLSPDVQTTPGENAQIAPSTSSSSEFEKTAVNLEGFRTEKGDLYTVFRDLKPKKSYNVIAAVRSISEPKTTSKGDWTRLLTLYDQSNYETRQAIMINCFSQYRGWLPSANVGDIVVLRDMKVVEYGDSIAAVGYKDRLKWAIYDSVTGTMGHGDRDGAPERDGLAAGYGYVFSPYWTAGEIEISRCKELSTWWTEIKTKGLEESGEVHHIQAASKSKREHRLICEADPGVLGGYFDTTVQFLSGFPNENGVYSAYVTDYTSVHADPPTIPAWCPPGLANHIFKIEMWNEAAAFGPTMKAGDYYTLNNCRIKPGAEGYLEGSFSEVRKLRKLEEKDAKREPRLKALLERKAAWESSSEARNEFEHRLLKDSSDSTSFADYTVEVAVLHSINGPQGCHLYVTDYTSNPAFTILNEQWSYGLDKRILKISLYDRQIDMAEAVQSGRFYRIKKLRLRKTAHSKEVDGRLGGSERLISQLNSVDIRDDELKKLLQRKEDWQKELSAPNMGQQSRTSLNPTVIPTSDTPKRRPIPQGFSTIQEAIDCKKCPNKFAVVARVVDFYPFHLNQTVVYACMRCQKDLPRNRKGCLICAEQSQDEEVQTCFRLFLRLEDEEGTKIEVAVSDPEDCTILNGLVPVDLLEDVEAFDEFAARVRPLLGDLEQVHEGAIKPEDAHNPAMKFWIDCWHIAKDGKEIKVFSLVNHGPLDT